MTLTTALLCLALNVYHESRGEPPVGQIAVAHVTLNRSRAYNKPLCNVVLEPNQFAWTTKGVEYDPHGVPRLRPGFLPKERAAWLRSQQIALQAMVGKKPDPTKGAMYFHETSLKPRWSKKFKYVAVYGNHAFYRRPDRESLALHDKP